MSDTTRRLRPFLAHEWPALAGAGLMSGLITLAELAKPFPIALIIDELVAGREGAFAMSAHDYTVLAAIAALVVAIALLDAIGGYYSDLWLQSAGERIAHALRVVVYDHLQRLSLRFHLQREKGDLVTRVTSDVNSVGDLFAQSLGPLTQAVLLLIGMVVVTVWLDPILAAATCVMLPALLWVSFTYRKRVKAAARRQRVQDGEIASRATEALSAMSVIKAFGSEQLESERVVRPSELRMQHGIEVSKLQARFDGLVGVLVAVGTAAVVVVGVLRVAKGALSVGDLVVFASYARRANSPMRAIAREWTKVARTMAKADRIAELLAVDDLLVDRPGAYHGGRAEGAVELEDVRFGYRAERPVLDGVSLKIAPGEHVALIGPSGAGKSTLGALIARFYDPAAGRVLLDGHDARDCSLTWLRDQVGVLLQDTVLFTGTVDDNIAYASPADPDEIAEAARLAAADGFIESLPEGYATELGPQGLGLSGGQRQRIGIARTLLRDPAILILDEPTTALDAESEAQVLAGLEGLLRGRTAVMITHSLELARRADRVVVVDEGGIVADGPPAELLADGGAYLRVLDERRRRDSRRRPRTPADRALPQLPHLLDADDMAAALQRSLGAEADVAAVAVERVAYKPSDRARVHYTAVVDGRRHDAVALARADRDLAGEPSSDAYRRVAAIVRERTPGREPVTYDADLGAMISWLPFDPWLPGLVTPPASLVRRLQWAGLELGAGADRPRLLSYRPRSRAVLRLDGHVVKAYGDRRHYDRAVAGLHTAEAVPAPRLELGVRDLRLTVQPALDGAAPEDPRAVAAEAGAALARLHAEPGDGLRPRPPVSLLAIAAERAELAGVLVPRLRGRLDALVRRLGDELPATGPLVSAHGDFRAGQLLAGGDELVLIDFDDMCLAAPALDLATYVADAGSPDVLEPLLEGYGGRPEAFDWYLATVILEHVTEPFRRLAPRWPQGIEHNVRAAEEALTS